jgi:hypothetical protein
MTNAPSIEELPFGINNGMTTFSAIDEGTYQNIHGMPFKTAQEFENHYYMKGDSRMASMWTLVDELDTALAVAARLEEA